LCPLSASKKTLAFTILKLISLLIKVRAKCNLLSFGGGCPPSVKLVTLTATVVNTSALMKIKSSCLVALDELSK